MAGSKRKAVPRPKVTVDRVLAAYGAAIQADPADTEAVERLIEFAARVRPDVEQQVAILADNVDKRMDQFLHGQVTV